MELNLRPAGVVKRHQLAEKRPFLIMQAEHIIIPKLEFREATIREAIDYLKKKSVDLDVDSPPGDRGVNIVLKLEGSSGGGAPAGGAAAPAAGGIPGIPGLEAAPGAAPAVPGAAPAAVGNPADTRTGFPGSISRSSKRLLAVTSPGQLEVQGRTYVSVVPAERTDRCPDGEWKIQPDLHSTDSGAAMLAEPGGPGVCRRRRRGRGGWRW